MAVQSLVVTSTSTPTAVAGTLSSGTVHGYIRVRLKSLTGTHYLGDSGVTTAGYPLTTGDAAIEAVIVTGESLWSCSTGSATLAVLRMNETT